MQTRFLRYIISGLVLLMASISFAQTIGGIGATLKLDTARDGTTLPMIQATAENSPAAKADLKAGSFIIAVNGQPCRNKSLENVVALIRGEAGTTLTLTVADNATGKNPADHLLTRAVIQVVAPPDPFTSFSDECDKAVADLKKTGYKVVKNVNSECGDYFFSFDAEKHTYHVALIAISEKTGAAPPEAWVYDSNNEKAQTQLKVTNTTAQGNAVIYTMDGSIDMQAGSVGIVKTKSANKSCRNMRVVAYR